MLYHGDLHVSQMHDSPQSRQAMVIENHRVRQEWCADLSHALLVSRYGLSCSHPNQSTKHSNQASALETTEVCFKSSNRCGGGRNIVKNSSARWKKNENVQQSCVSRYKGKSDSSNTSGKGQPYVGVAATNEMCMGAI
jgi:hypothetical protein